MCEDPGQQEALEAGRLVCVECGRRERDGERGWRAYLTLDDQAAVFCPDCAYREFDVQ